MVSLVRLL